MRININNIDNIEKVVFLCELYDCSPTQLVIDLINNTHQQYAQGCKEDAKEDKNTLYGSPARIGG